MNESTIILEENDKSFNLDPITKAPGSHPIGTGLGAAAGGAAAGAAVGTVAGPAGTLAGAVIGAVVGGLAGKGIAESVNPTAEEAYWRINHYRQSYANGRAYDLYGPAYRNGYEGYAEYGAAYDRFEDRELVLRKSYEANTPELVWADARPASQAAWQRSKEQRALAKRN